MTPDVQHEVVDDATGCASDHPGEHDAGAAPDGRDPVAAGRPDLSVRTAYILTMSFVALNLVAALMAGVIAQTGGAGVDVTFLLFGLLIAVYGITLLITWRVVSAHGRGFATTVGLKRVGAEAVAYGAAVAVGLRFVAGLWAWFVQALGLQLQGADIDPSKLLPAGLAGDVLTAFLIVVAAPFVEEIIFRGVFQAALLRRYSAALAVSGSALLFTIVHFNAFASVPILFAGVAFGLLAIRWGSLWPAITAHAVFNGVGLAFLYVARYLGVA